MRKLEIGRSWDGWLVRGVCVLLLAGLFTLCCVQESRKIGRLALPPNYDDVTYCHQGMILARFIEHKGGLDGIKSFLAHRDLHSPYSIFLAGASYLVLGFGNASPYYANVLVVVLFLSCLSWLLRNLPFVAWLLSLLIFLTLPFITMGVVEFRPDIAWAIAAGFGTVFIVTSERLLRSPKNAAVAGVFLALSLLTKPSTFVMTLLLYSGAFVSRGIALFPLRQAGKVICDSWKGILAFAATVLLGAGPYWFFYGRDAYEYFMENSFGVHKGVWVFQGGLWKSLFFYISGEGWASNIGIPGTLLMLIVLASVVYLFLKKPELRWKLIVLTAATLGALAVNTFAEMKSPFLGGGIYGVWIFFAAYVLSEVYQLPDFTFPCKPRWHWKLPLLAVLALASMGFYRWPQYSKGLGDTVSRVASCAAQEFMEKTLNQHFDALPGSILFLQGGPIVPEGIGMWLVARNKMTPVYEGGFLQDKKVFSKVYQFNDWIVMQDPGLEGSYSTMPSEQHLREFDEIVRADSTYHILAEHVFSSGKKVWIFSRK